MTGPEKFDNSFGNSIIRPPARREPQLSLKTLMFSRVVADDRVPKVFVPCQGSQNDVPALKTSRSSAGILEIRQNRSNSSKNVNERPSTDKSSHAFLKMCFLRKYVRVSFI